MVLPARGADQSRPEVRTTTPAPAPGPLCGRPGRRAQAAVQASVTPSSDPVTEPRNPNVVEAPAPSVPFQSTLRAVTVDDEPVRPAFHTCATETPAGSVSVTAHPRSAAAPAVTVTSPWIPPGQDDTVRSVAVQP